MVAQNIEKKWVSGLGMLMIQRHHNFTPPMSTFLWRCCEPVWTQNVAQCRFIHVETKKIGSNCQVWNLWGLIWSTLLQNNQLYISILCLSTSYLNLNYHALNNALINIYVWAWLSEWEFDKIKWWVLMGQTCVQSCICIYPTFVYYMSWFVDWFRSV